VFYEPIKKKKKKVHVQTWFSKVRVEERELISGAGEGKGGPSEVRIKNTGSKEKEGILLRKTI